MTSTIGQNPTSEAWQVSLLTTTLGENITLQLSQAVDAGIIIFLPSPNRIRLDPVSTKPSDPDPPIKWVKDGFAVVSITDYDGIVVTEALKQGLDALQNLNDVRVKNKSVVIGKRFSYPRYHISCRLHSL